MNIRLFLITMAALLGLPGIARSEQPVSRETFVYAVKGSDTLRLDTYSLAADTARPCVMFVFGGGFAAGRRDRKSYLDYFEFLVRDGYVVVSIDYRLGLKGLTDGTIDAGQLKAKDFISTFENSVFMAVEDFFDATNFLLRNAASLGVDPSRIVASGSSAGAITVLQGEYERCNRMERASVLPHDFRYAGIISFAGAIYSNSGKLKWKGTPAPVLLFHGDADRNVPFDKIKILKYGFYGSEYIASRYDKNKYPYYFYKAVDADHSVAVSPMTGEQDEIRSFLQKYVSESQQIKTNVTVAPLEKKKVKKNFGLGTYIKSNI